MLKHYLKAAADHEAGQAVMAYLLKSPFVKISINGPLTFEPFQNRRHLGVWINPPAFLMHSLTMSQPQGEQYNGACFWPKCALILPVQPVTEGAA